MAVALTTMATLILELSLTRIFSVVFYYHFAFLAISIALFGLGAGGVLSYFFSTRGPSLYSTLGRLAAGGAASTALALFFMLRIAGFGGTWMFALVYFLAAVPFLFSGCIVSIAISTTMERVDRVYFFDLLGAAGGCLLLIPFLNIVGGPGTVLTAAVLLAASSAIWFGLAHSRSGRTLGVAVALALVALIIYNQQSKVMDIRVAKGRELQNEEFTRWNSFSRIAVTADPGGGKTVVIDADATTGIAQFDFDHLSPADRKKLGSEGPGFPYHIRPGGKTLIIGAGGGWDVARALASGSRDITGVEINPITANTIMRQRYLDVSHRLYLRPEVRIFIEDGRSFVRRSDEKYQVIQATLVDTWASTAAGAFALSENMLYTSDAFVDYFQHLTADGILAFTRWGFDPPRESLRLVSLAQDALERLGERDISTHVIVVRESGERLQGWGATDTVLFSRKPFSADDVEEARRSAQAGGFEIVYLPGQGRQNAFSELLTTSNRKAFFEKYQYNVKPVADDRPFFFYTVQPRDLWGFAERANHQSADFKVNLAVPTLFSVVGVSMLAVLITLLLPPVLLGTRLPSEPGLRGFLWYFICLGAGYILIQVSLIQQLVLMLGHPTYALTVVIFSMLVSSGVGSYFSRKLTLGAPARLSLVLAGVFGVAVVLAGILPTLSSAAAGWPLPAKMLLTVALIAPAGFLMGIPFPTGLSWLEQWSSPSVRWAWSLNAAASVFGSGMAMFCAIQLGLRWTLIAGAGLYLVALWRASRAQDPMRTALAARS